MTTYRILKNWISRRIYSSSPVRHAGRYLCLTSRNVSPVAVLSDTLCLTFFSLSVFELNHRKTVTVTFSKTFGMCSDYYVWQGYGMLFLNYDLYHRVLSDICQTGQKWAKTACGANHTLGRLTEAARVPARRSTRAQGMPDRLPRPDTPYERFMSDIWCQTSSSIQIQGKIRTFCHYFLSQEKLWL